MSDLRESLTQSGTLYGFINTIVYAHDYNDLTNKPQINGVTLTGNKTASELGLVTPATEAVQSVNGETGAVVLDGNDIDYDSTKTINQQIDAVAASIPVMAVTSVNGETGDVVLDGSDIRYDADYTVSAKIAAVEGDIPVVPVQSVNGETGNVVLDGDDIAYNSSLSVNQKIDAVEAAIPVVSYPVTSVNSKTGAVVLDDSDIEHSSGVSVNSIINTMVGYIPVYGNTASGAIATFDTSLALPLQDCTIEINAVQESGTPTPSSPKAISGFTGANIKVTGSNLWDEVWELGDLSASTGEKTNDTTRFRSKNYIPVTPNTTIYCYTANYTGRKRIAFYDSNKAYLGQETGFDVMPNGTYTTPSNAFYALFYIEGTTYGNDVSINYPATDTAYHAYNANSTTTAISWNDEAGTVYGGSLDVTSGELTVTYAIVDMGSFAWNNASGNLSSSSGIASDVKAPSANTQAFNGLCSCYEVAARTGISDKQISVQTNGNIVISDTAIAGMTGEQVKAYVNGFILVYELATPVTYQLTPTQISAIVGTNNVFTDTNGDTSVVYACSLKDYIDSQ